MTTEDESALRVDAIREKVAPVIMHEPLFETSMALMLLASLTTLHDGGSEEDFLALAKATYRRAVDAHQRKCA
jgi:hypothetical protein